MRDKMTKIMLDLLLKNNVAGSVSIQIGTDSYRNYENFKPTCASVSRLYDFCDPAFRDRIVDITFDSSSVQPAWKWITSKKLVL